MSGTKLTPAVEEYLSVLRQVRASGGSTPELSYYPALSEFVSDRPTGATSQPPSETTR